MKNANENEIGNENEIFNSNDNKIRKENGN